MFLRHLNLEQRQIGGLGMDDALDGGRRRLRRRRLGGLLRQGECGLGRLCIDLLRRLEVVEGCLLWEAWRSSRGKSFEWRGEGIEECELPWRRVRRLLYLEVR